MKTLVLFFFLSFAATAFSATKELICNYDQWIYTEDTYTVPLTEAMFETGGEYSVTATVFRKFFAKPTEIRTPATLRVTKNNKDWEIVLTMAELKAYEPNSKQWLTRKTKIEWTTKAKGFLFFKSNAEAKMTYMFTGAIKETECSCGIRDNEFIEN